MADIRYTETLQVGRSGRGGRPGRPVKADRWRINLVHLVGGKRKHFFSVTVKGSASDMMRALQALRDGGDARS